MSFYVMYVTIVLNHLTHLFTNIHVSLCVGLLLVTTPPPPRCSGYLIHIGVTHYCGYIRKSIIIVWPIIDINEDEVTLLVWWPLLCGSVKIIFVCIFLLFVSNNEVSISWRWPRCIYRDLVTCRVIGHWPLYIVDIYVVIPPVKGWGLKYLHTAVIKLEIWIGLWSGLWSSRQSP